MAGGVGSAPAPERRVTADSVYHLQGGRYSHYGDRAQFAGEPTVAGAGVGAPMSAWQGGQQQQPQFASSGMHWPSTYPPNTNNNNTSGAHNYLYDDRFANRRDSAPLVSRALAQEQGANNSGTGSSNHSPHSSSAHHMSVDGGSGVFSGHWHQSQPHYSRTGSPQDGTDATTGAAAQSPQASDPRAR